MALQLVQARLQASLDLYKALGGGWHAPPIHIPGMVICLVCRQCGKRIPLHDSAIADPLSRLAIDNGLAIGNEHIEIVVSCHGCEKEVNEV